MPHPNNKNPGSEDTLHRIDIEYSFKHACLCIVASELAERNPDELAVAFANPEYLLNLPKSSVEASDRLALMVAENMISEDDADELKEFASLLANFKHLDPTTDALLYLSCRLAAAAITEEKSSGVPGLWSTFVAGAETLRPYARKAGESRYE